MIPATSKEAYQSVQKMIPKHHEVILAAMAKIPGLASSERIALFSKLDRYQVARRLKEMELYGMVERCNTLDITTKGRKCLTWKIKTNQTELEFQ